MGDKDNFGFGGSSDPTCDFFDNAQPPEDFVGAEKVFDYASTSPPVSSSWTHTFVPGSSFDELQIREYFSDTLGATITIDGVTTPFESQGDSQCIAPKVQKYPVTAAQLADGQLNVTVTFNGDVIALDYSELVGAGPPPPSGDLCFGQPATITGNGVVNGTEGDDVIITGNGNDIVDGKGGNDRICTRGGDDHARGGAGNDRLNSGNGNDNTGGQSGNDIVQSTGGNDDVQGGDGMDHVTGGEGNDTLNGGNDVDAVEGEGGNDLLAGNAGSPDYCDGGAGTDATPANGGCETIVGIP